MSHFPYEGTKVSVNQSIQKIEKLLDKFGAEEFSFHKSKDKDGDPIFRITFVFKRLPASFTVNPWSYALAWAHYHGRGEPSAASMLDSGKAARCAMRALEGYVKAQLVHVELGLADFEDVFLPHFLLGGRHSISEVIKPNLEAMVHDPRGFFTEGAMKALPGGDR